MRSQETWTCPIKLGKKKRDPTRLLITTPEELPDIQRIRAELRYDPMVMDPTQVESTPPEQDTTTPSFAQQTPEQFSGTCQFCDWRMSTLQCACEMGMLLRIIWKSSMEPTSRCPWERIRRLLDDAEDSSKKRQRRDANSTDKDSVSARGRALDSPRSDRRSPIAESVFARGRTLESPRVDRRGASSTMDSAHSSIDKVTF